jgi:hypothetical protein
MTTWTPVSRNAEHAVNRARPLLWPSLALAVTICLAALAGTAQAANPRETEAAKLFFAGQYPDALKIYVDLAVATGDPAYMCEIGRCYSRMGKPEEASRNLRDCLSQATLTPKKKREFQALQTEVELARAAPPPPPTNATMAAPQGPAAPPPGWTPAPAAGAAAPGYPAAPPPGYAPAPGQAAAPGQPSYPGAPQAAPGYPQGPAPGAGGPPPGWAPPAQGQSLPPAAPPAAGTGSDNQLAASSDAGKREGGGGGWMTPTAYVVGSVGVLAAAGGVAAGLMAKGKFDDVSKEYNDAKYKNAKTLNTVQYIGYGVGAVGIGTAITLFLLAPDASESHAAGGFHLIAAPDSVGLAGTF